MTARRKVSSRRSPRGRKPRARVALAAHSSRTGITHVFGDIKEAQRLANQFKKARKAKLEIDLINSISFWAWIKGLDPLTTKPDFIWKKSVYRLTDGWSPHSIVGSISDGGRFNVGGAQLCPELSDIKKAGALYTASTLECCYSEIKENPVGKPDEYELTPKKPFHLWDLSKVILDLKRGGLGDIVKAIPFEAIWGYQKVPLISQILAHYLRQIGGDGLVFPSTKDPNALNICFFFKTDDEANSSLSFRKLN